MKKITVLSLLLLFLFGCKSTSNIEAVLNYQPQHLTDVFQVSITENEKPISDLQVVGTFEMAKMDHGSAELEFHEIDNGLYETNLDLPMDGDWVSNLTITQDEEDFEQLILFQVSSEGTQQNTKRVAPEKGVVSTINGQPILEDDLEFYHFINHLQITLYREKDKQSHEGKELEELMQFWDAQEKEAGNVNTLLTQIIRLRAVALLATEKGHTSTPEEVDHEMAKVKNELMTQPVAKELIQQFGEDRFWEKQQSQYELIVLSQKVQQDMLDKVKEEKPDAEITEVNYLAHQEYEELLVAQIESLNIEVYLQ
ncbi:FixH family protein [Alkalihalobacillus sp. BA299]|uniref:FixH family protein n=1 Tax=Alkalihalobacillus sp. BA299 TaxID=2815938 RepID=UPI001AD973F6|nr:FixH family protein [Alkalihalobacillus sp. BA299]